MTTAGMVPTGLKRNGPDLVVRPVANAKTLV